MNLQTDFEIAAGSSVGRDHIKFRKNNQDAFCFHQSDEIIVALIADGCGSQPFSEVGSHMGIKLLKDIILNRFCKTSDRNILVIDPKLFLQKCQNELESKIALLGNYDDNFLIKHYSFTIMGLIITKEMTYTFSFGDGIYGINKKISNIGPYPNDMPPYIVYNCICPFRTKKIDESLLHFELQAVTETSNIENIFIGTDGIDYLIDAQNQRIPGRENLIGPIDQFWIDDIYFKNPYAIQKKLFSINNSMVKIDWENHLKKNENGPLKDDTTLIVIRKKKEK